LRIAEAQPSLAEQLAQHAVFGLEVRDEDRTERSRTVGSLQHLIDQRREPAQLGEQIGAVACAGEADERGAAERAHRPTAQGLHGLTREIVEHEAKVRDELAPALGSWLAELDAH
jgi:hypothetical protein